MRTGVLTAFLAVTIAFTGVAVPSSGRAEEAAAEAEKAPPPDPTRGQWDSFLDPLRDVEDQVTGVQKSVEDSTKIHVGAGYTQAYTWSFNEPPAGTLALHSLERHDEPTPT